MAFRLILLAFLLSAALHAQDAGARQRANLETLQKLLKPTNRNITGRINAHDKDWAEWQARTGELPPDFDSMPSVAELPDPFTFEIDGEQVVIETPEQWDRKKALIREQFEQWVYGSVPPPPDYVKATKTGEREDGELTIQSILLEFGPDEKAKLRLELIVPPGEGPFPVFLTNHARTRPWLSTAVRRGYLACVYFAADPNYGYEDDSDTYIEAYPDHDFSTIARWGWSASRAIDYLVLQPQVDGARIALAGHSRNGKQALFAAAFDTRIAAVVPSSGNTGEGNPWRYTADIFRNETIEQITGNFPHWFHPRLRFFVGREDKLPVDQNLLMALVAPRGLMLASAFSEHQGNAFGFEQAYRSVRQVYEFLGVEDQIALYMRPGIHSTTAGVIEDYVDFFDAIFGRGDFSLPEDWTHGYDFDSWRDISNDAADPLEFPQSKTGAAFGLGGDPVSTLDRWRNVRGELLEQLRWALGDEPPGVTFPAREKLDGLGMTSDGWLGQLHGRPLLLSGGAETKIPFGDDLVADFYYPGEPGQPAREKLPVVLWLHEHAYPTGYSRYARRPFESLIKRGFAVLAFDQIGFGTRALDARRFYERYPSWSLLGKMTADTRAAVDALAALGRGGVIDPDRIYAVGYALGAKVGLWTAAMDDRISAVAAVNGFSPLRLASFDKGIEGIKHYSHLHGLAPRLGFFIGGEGEEADEFAGFETRLPIDYDEILGLIAPRPVLVSAAKMDRYHPVDDVRAAVSAAQHAWRLHGQEGKLTLLTPEDFNRFEAERQEEIFDWLESLR